MSSSITIYVNGTEITKNVPNKLAGMCTVLSFLKEDVIKPSQAEHLLLDINKMKIPEAGALSDLADGMKKHYSVIFEIKVFTCQSTCKKRKCSTGYCYALP
jgi:hypothetical protein